MTSDATSPGASPGRRVRRRRRAVVLGLALAVLVLLVSGAALAAFRYLPALDEARGLRTDLETMVGRVQEAGLGIDQATMDQLDADLASASGRLAHVRDLLATDPLVGLARGFPPTSANVHGADDVVAAAGDLLIAVDNGLAIGHRFVEIRQEQAADPGNASALSQLVELMATSRDQAVAASAAVAQARERLARVPDGLVGQVESVRDSDGRADREVRPAPGLVRDGQRSLAGDAGLGRASALPGPHPGPGRAPPQRRAHRELRHHRVRSRANHRAPLPRRRLRWTDVRTTRSSSRRRSSRTTCSAPAALAARRRGLVAGLPDQRAGRLTPLHQRVRRRADRRRARDHDVHDRRAAEGDGADDRPGL